MKPFLFLAGLWALALSWVLGEETVVLKGGQRLQGEVLKRSAVQVVLDIGFDVIRIPADEVVTIETLTAGKTAPNDGEKAVGMAEAGEEGLYTLGHGGDPRSVGEHAAALGEAVVQIRTPTGLGSGFVIHPEGYVMTNHHVISGEHRLSVLCFRQTERALEKVVYPRVKIVATSPVMDLALLKIETEEGLPFAHVPIGSSRRLRAGQMVFAIGSPLGLGRSVSEGIVSVPNRVVSGGLFYIQHTAQINPGNSGGPLFNLQGEVVGVLNMKMASIGVEGMGFAIPSSVLRLFLDHQDAYAFDPRNPNAGFRYLDPPGGHSEQVKASQSTSPEEGPERAPPPGDDKSGCGL